MTRPIIEKRRLRGPSELRDRAVRREAQRLGQRFVVAFSTAMAGKHPDFVIEAARWVIRAMSKVVEARGDIGRAHGVLAGAQAHLTPAWTAEGSADRAAAEALFAETL